MSRMPAATAALLLALSAAPAIAQQPPPPAEAHLAHLLDRFPGTPEAQGLLATALGEARVAAQHAALGAQDPTDLEAMKRHANHVRHALDDASVESGPGLGFGLVQAASGLVTHTRLAARSDGATEGMITHSVHVLASAGNTLERAERILAIAETIAEYAETAEEAALLFADLESLADALLGGVDADGDGQIGWQEGEGGLQHVEQHLGFMRNATGAP